MSKNRCDIAQEDKWDVEALYSNLVDWESCFEQITSCSSRPHWPVLAEYRGTLHNGAAVVQAFLEKQFNLGRSLHKLYTWAHLRHDEELTNDEYKKAFNGITALLHDFEQEISWFEPELLSLPKAQLTALLDAAELKPYRFYLEKIIRLQPHTLSADGEELLAMAQQPLDAISKTFSALNNADFSFGSAIDSEGTARPITHAQYALYVRDNDRVLRESAFKTMHGYYLSFENSLCELINGQVQKNIFNARARKFSSSLEAALFPKNIDTAVYHALIKAVNSRLGEHHKYMALRKRLLGLEKMHLWDVYVPITPQVDMRLTYDEAEEAVIDSVAPLGSDYQDKLRAGLKSQRWVDRYENKNKRSGAYSSGCYDSNPYILMNFNGLLRDTFTLAHEAGHSMHSLLSNSAQPYHYADYPIFLAEVASTFNEELLMRHLLQKSGNVDEQIFLVNQKIEDIRTTLFRQTMFAEFELLIHQLVEAGTSLTPALLKERYRELNKRYFGPAVEIDEQIDIEWARIPHFYYNFYVYQYATGISAALALSSKVMDGGASSSVEGSADSAREGYLNFLRSGGSRFPIDTLELAGVDMRSGKAVDMALQRFADLVMQLDTLASAVR